MNKVLRKEQMDKVISNLFTFVEFTYPIDQGMELLIFDLPWGRIWYEQVE